jgi:hypothetical protein
MTIPRSTLFVFKTVFGNLVWRREVLITSTELVLPSFLKQDFREGTRMANCKNEGERTCNGN